MTSLAGQHAPGIHLPPSFNAVDMSSCLAFYKGAEDLNSSSLRSKGCNLPSPHQDVVYCNRHALLSAVCISLSDGLFSQGGSSSPMCLCVCTQNRVDLSSGDLTRRQTRSDCKLWGTKEPGCTFKTQAVLGFEPRAGIPYWRKGESEREEDGMEGREAGGRGSRKSH